MFHLLLSLNKNYGPKIGSKISIKIIAGFFFLVHTVLKRMAMLRT